MSHLPADPVKSLLDDVEKDSSSGSASLKSNSDFFSKSEQWMISGKVPGEAVLIGINKVIIISKGFESI
ncbi:hypothetical protein TNCV_4783211 [Trichonephila clavipes]|nr:hypothetical protein TNCV_4783211 [Trichonephila clavipes]